jgi:hypothetical protein
MLSTALRGLMILYRKLGTFKIHLDAIAERELSLIVSFPTASFKNVRM